MAGWRDTNMITKLIYSLILVLIVGGIFFELRRIWFDKKIYIGRFDVVSSETKPADAGKLFALQVASNHALLVEQMRAYGRRDGQGSADPTFDLRSEVPINVSTDALGELYLTYQNVNIGAAITALRKMVVRPNEITGTVTSTQGYVQAGVSWPKAPLVPAAAGDPPTYFVTEGRSSDAEAARLVACGLIWGQAAAKVDAIAKVSRNQYCRWAEALSTYMALRAKSGSLGGLNDQDVQLAGKVNDKLGELIRETSGFVEANRLRADVVDLLPPDKSSAFLVQAQQDRLTYAIAKDPTLAKLPPDRRRWVAFARARPAIQLDDGVLKDTPDNWRFLLDPRAAQIDAAADAVGYIAAEGSSAPATGSGFVVGPNMVLTMSVVVEAMQDFAPGKPLYFCTADSQASPCPANRKFAVTKVIAAPGTDPARPALLEIAVGRRTLTPLALAPAPADLSGLLDRYVYVLGYPSAGDQRVPAEVRRALLGDGPTVKRIMPGRSLSIGPQPGGAGTESARLDVLRADASTTGGAGGGPLVDLASGRVIGIHSAGQWDDDRGKFSFAQLFTPAVVAWLDDYVHPGQPLSASAAPPAPPSPQPAGQQTQAQPPPPPAAPPAGPPPPPAVRSSGAESARKPTSGRRRPRAKQGT